MSSAKFQPFWSGTIKSLSKLRWHYRNMWWLTYVTMMFAYALMTNRHQSINNYPYDLTKCYINHITQHAMLQPLNQQYLGKVRWLAACWFLCNCWVCCFIIHGDLSNWLFLGPTSIWRWVSRYGDFHYKEKTVMRPSNLYNRNSYSSKTVSLYCDNPLGPVSI